jgi:hypothetical protein
MCRRTVPISILSISRFKNVDVDKYQKVAALSGPGSAAHLIVALPERLHAQLVPVVVLVDLVAALQRDLDVAALDGQVEAGALVLDEVEGHLREALLLQVRNDGLPAQLRSADHLEHQVVLALHGEEVGNMSALDRRHSICLESWRAEV